MPGDRLIILVAEDDPDDVLLLEQAFQKAGLEKPAHICADGAEAIAYLNGEGIYADRQKYPLPHLLITDLKMPRRSGFDLLEWLKNAPPERSLVAKMVLSTSAAQTDVKRAYELGANCFFQKPNTFEELASIIELANRFWRRTTLPALEN